ncbi:MAG: hypothetical protein ACLS48_13145 [[Eubacterium] siraeum]
MVQARDSAENLIDGADGEQSPHSWLGDRATEPHLDKEASVMVRGEAMDVL